MRNINNFLNLKKKLAFVIGGNGLIGKKISLSLALHGAKVVIIDKNIKNLKKLNSKIIYEQLDVTQEDAYRKYSKIMKKYKSPDIFINCSYPRTKDWENNSIKKISLKSLKKNIDYHLISYTWLAKETAEKMKKSKKNTSIILLSSIYGILGQDLTLYERTSMRENLSYSVIKGGIVNLSKQLASYYGKDKIRVNTICPGGVFDGQNRTFVKNYNKRVPLKRMAKSQEIANVVLFLSSDASSYITGSTLIVDGGWSAV